ncbi:MAG: flagellar hook-associated protein FlgL [bacterium]|nr:flagellar hook-associated protein FlgL [bacterium]
MQRVTNSVMISDLIRTLNERMRNLSDFQNQVATGKRVYYASDDPAATGLILSLRNNLRQNDQFQENIDGATSWLQNTESVLQGLNEMLIQVRADAVEGSNESTSPEAMAALATEVNEYLENLLSQSNSDYSGKTIFGGTYTNELPFNAVRDPITGDITSITANSNGIEGALMRQVGSNNSMQINISGQDLFQPGGSGADGDMFQVMINLRDALNAGDPTAVGDMLDQIDGAMANVQDFTSLVGAKVTQLTSMMGNLLMQETTMTGQLSNQEDVDLVEVMTNLTMEQNAYQAALATSAKIIQPSLVDFL